jgi:hypothetical protein
MTGLRDTTCRCHLSRLHGGCRVTRGDAARPVDRTRHVATSSADSVGDAVWPIDDGWPSAPTSRIVLLLVGGSTAATLVWVGVVATTVATVVSSWT